VVDNDLVVSPELCTCSSEKVECFGYVITADGIEMAEEKINVIKEWKVLKLLRDIQSFLRLANIYPHFIKNFSKICRPPTDSTKGERTDWG
jgi:hypothetical protein